MSIRRKTFLIIAAVVLALALLFIGAARVILLESYQQIDAQNALSSIERAEVLLESEIERQLAITVDYARWDDTYTFIIDPTPEYVQTNLDLDFLVNLGIDFMVFLDADGQIVLSRVVDMATGDEIPLPAGIEAHLNPESPLLNLPDTTSAGRGILVTEAGPLLLTASPIITSRGEGPIRGTLVFGRLLDAPRIADLADRMRLPLTITTAPPPDGAHRQALTDAESVAGLAWVAPLDDGPGLLLRVDLPRTIYQQGQATIVLFGLLLGVGGLVLVLASLLLLERLVIARIVRLQDDVHRIGSDMSARVRGGGADELGRLAGGINHMLDSLQSAQRDLRERDERLQTVVNGAPILLWAVDRALQITLMQGKELDALGLRPADVVGRPAGAVLTPQIIEEAERALRGETFSSIVPLQHFTFETRYTPIRDEDGAITGVIGIAADITARTQAEQALSQTAQDLERQKRQLERARVLFRSTLDQLSDTVQRGAPREELNEYLTFVEAQFKRLD